MLPVEFRAYGKINLVLAVGNRREDGFHSVETVLHRAEVFDVIRISESSEKGIRIICDCPSVPTDASNLVHRAISEYCRALGRADGSFGYLVEIEKHIPVSGGMGGGSADAGWVLRELNIAEGEPLGIEKIAEIAASLGSDVPFFVYGLPAMLGVGRGERMLPCPKMPECRMELRACGSKPSTGAMYAALDAMREEENARNNEGDAALDGEGRGTENAARTDGLDEIPWENRGICRGVDGVKGYSPRIEKMLRALEGGSLDEVCGAISNDFEPVFIKNNREAEPSFEEIREDMLSRGARAVFLCGSGPTVCGVFPPDGAV